MALLVLPAISVHAQGNLNLGLDKADSIGLSNGGSAGLVGIINNIIKVLLGFLGLFAVILVLYGGFLWMTSQGDESKTDKAKKLIMAGIVGLLIILAAYAIAAFVINNLSNSISNT